jgi:serine/threonine-protein kinase
MRLSDVPPSGSASEQHAHLAAWLSGALSPPDALPLGTVIAGYRILEGPLHGGMGVVYRAQKLGAPASHVVALKMMRSEVQIPPVARELFRKEVETLARLRHPAIVRLYDAGDHEGELYFTMEWMEGRTLEAYLAHRIEPRAAAATLERIARAVEYLHQKGVLHLDLKPANILIDARGLPHVSDFGLTDVLGASRGHGGTLDYMAPEAPSSAPSTAWDVYALGVMLRELVATGDAGHSVLDRDLAAICRRATERDPALRYGTAAALADDLAAWLRGEPVAARPGPSLRRARHFGRRHPFPVAGAVWTIVALAIIAAGLAWSVERLRERLIEATIDANQYAAQHVAGNLLRVLGDAGDMLLATAQDPELSALALGEPLGNVRYLERHLQDQFQSIGVYALSGARHARWPEMGPLPYGIDFAWRDYLQGAAAAGAAGRAEVYVARSIRSEADRKHKLVLSTPLFLDGRFAGVLMATIETASTFGIVRIEQTSADGPFDSLIGVKDRERGAAGGPPPRGYRVLVHPKLVTGKSADVDAALAGALFDVFGAPAAAGRQLRPRAPQPAEVLRREPHRLPAYRDPVDDTGASWLAAVAPVGATGLVVLVQSRHGAVVSASHLVTGPMATLMLALLAGSTLVVTVLLATRPGRADAKAPPALPPLPREDRHCATSSESVSIERWVPRSRS